MEFSVPGTIIVVSMVMVVHDANASNVSRCVPAIINILPRSSIAVAREYGC